VWKAEAKRQATSLQSGMPEQTRRGSIKSTLEASYSAQAIELAGVVQQEPEYDRCLLSTRMSPGVLRHPKVPSERVPCQTCALRVTFPLTL
jgi:hypothetical protein